MKKSILAVGAVCMAAMGMFTGCSSIEQQSPDTYLNELNQFIDGLGEFLNEVKAASTGTYLRDEVRVQQLLFSYAVMKKYTSGIDVTVDCKVHEPVESMGSVTIEGREIALGNMEWFCRAAEFSNSTEIYPLVNGKTRLTFTFHGLVKKIG